MSGLAAVRRRIVAIVSAAPFYGFFTPDGCDGLDGFLDLDARFMLEVEIIDEASQLAPREIEKSGSTDASIEDCSLTLY